MTVEKKRVKALAHDPDTEFKLLKENHKKDKLIEERDMVINMLEERLGINEPLREFKVVQGKLIGSKRKFLEQELRKND